MTDLLTDRFVVEDALGHRLDRAEACAVIQGMDVRWERVEVRQVTLNGERAVVRIVDDLMLANGSPVRREDEDTWIRTPSGWRMSSRRQSAVRP
ncbi:MAG: hypothetical protein ACYCW6_20040 [Candidatus Xenobia bacterium]